MNLRFQMPWISPRSVVFDDSIIIEVGIITTLQCTGYMIRVPTWYGLL